MKVLHVLMLAVVLATSLASNSKAQTWDEILRQKKTQEKYLLQQIAGLKVYAELAGIGYRVAGQSLNLISDIKNGDLSLHSAFFKGLKTVHPAFRKLPEVFEIIAAEINIVRGCARDLKLVRNFRVFNTNEAAYVEQVYGKLKKDCYQITEEMFSLLLDGNMEMSDAKRLKSIGNLHESMQDNLDFFKRFSEETMILSLNRNKELQDIEASRRRIGIQ